MTHKTRELEGALLNTAVALALGYKHLGAVGTVEPDVASGKPWCLSGANDWWEDLEGNIICGPCTGFPYDYSTDWARGGPIIQRERIAIYASEGGWRATPPVPRWYDGQSWIDIDDEHAIAGPTPLIAAMRAYIASKLGEEVELP